jgi:hypothetical protein
MLRMMFNVMQTPPKCLSLNGIMCCVWFCVCVARGLAAETGARGVELFGQPGGGSPPGAQQAP